MIWTVQINPLVCSVFCVCEITHLINRELVLKFNILILEMIYISHTTLLKIAFLSENLQLVRYIFLRDLYVQ